jgi:hypothetical protein
VDLHSLKVDASHTRSVPHAGSISPNHKFMWEPSFSIWYLQTSLEILPQRLRGECKYSPNAISRIFIFNIELQANSAIRPGSCDTVQEGSIRYHPGHCQAQCTDTRSSCLREAGIELASRCPDGRTVPNSLRACWHIFGIIQVSESYPILVA